MHCTHINADAIKYPEKSNPRPLWRNIILIGAMINLCACGSGGDENNAAVQTPTDGNAQGQNFTDQDTLDQESPDQEAPDQAAPGTEADTETPDEEALPRPIESRTATLSWFLPDERENGEALTLDEIKGFEVQYRKVDADNPFCPLGEVKDTYCSITILDPTRAEFDIPALETGIYEFTVAVFDTEDIYSRFTETLTATVDSLEETLIVVTN